LKRIFFRFIFSDIRYEPIASGGYQSHKIVLSNKRLVRSQSKDEINDSSRKINISKLVGLACFILGRNGHWSCLKGK
jgi:hypothetical protein